jgi:8-oxo-dGTP pyrophosphatase MutT (NUDIX family)
MRFRRRSEAPPPEGGDDETDDETVWARPEDEAADGGAAGEPVPPEPVLPEDGEPPASEVVEGPANELGEEPYYEVVEEPAVELPEEQYYEVVEEPAVELPEEQVDAAEDEPVDELDEVSSTPVTSWSGGPDHLPPGAEGVVRAAGGVVWSRWQGGLRVVVVHRPRYDDWSLPKGKAGPGESDADCALREVREETGLACSLGQDLGTISYHDRHGRLKTVRYFAMEPLGGGETPQHEVDEVRWLPLEEARRLLSYERDVGVLDALVDMTTGRREFDAPPEG